MLSPLTKLLLSLLVCVCVSSVCAHAQQRQQTQSSPFLSALSAPFHGGSSADSQWLPLMSWTPPSAYLDNLQLWLMDCRNNNHTLATQMCVSTGNDQVTFARTGMSASLNIWDASCYSNSNNAASPIVRWDWQQQCFGLCFLVFLHVLSHFNSFDRCTHHWMLDVQLALHYCMCQSWSHSVVQFHHCRHSCVHSMLSFLAAVNSRTC